MVNLSSNWNWNLNWMGLDLDCPLLSTQPEAALTPVLVELENELYLLLMEVLLSLRASDCACGLS